MSTLRDAIRKQVFADKIKTVIVDLPDGSKVEVRQTSVGQMLDMIKEQDNKKQIVRMLIESCYVPGTNDRVFDSADYEILLDLPADGVYRKLFDAVNSFSLQKELDEAGKDSSEETPSSS